MVYLSPGCCRDLLTVKSSPKAYTAFFFLHTYWNDLGLKFGANALTVSGSVKGLEAGSSTLKVAGVDAPSLLTDHVINFLPPGVDLPPTVNLQTSGTAVLFGGSTDDDYELEPLPFTFPFFDRNDEETYVSTNGYLTFDAGDSEYEWDTPEDFLSMARVAPFATDLYLFGDSSVFTNEITIAGCDAFVVTWEDMGIFFESGLGGIHTFQVVLFETGAIQLRYGDINNAPSDTEEEVWVGVSPQPPQFDRPHGIWSDGKYLYITERGNSSVRRVEIATREVTLLAGDPNGGSGTADGFSTAARFKETAGIWGDGDGSVYIAERANYAIRKLDLATGEVTTIAGLKGTADAVDGTGTDARFGELGALWGDGDGNLFVADAGNHVIRKIVIATGEVTTLAGTFGVTGSADDFGADAGFYEPWGVWGDNLGNLYIGEDTNATIRKIVIATGEVTTVAGDADTGGTADGFGVAARLDRPRGLWGDNMGHLYFSEVGNHAIRKIDLATGEVTTLAGLKQTSDFADGVGTTARFDFPNAIFGHGGYLYIVDDRNDVIRRMDISTLEVESIAGWVDNADLKDGTGALTPVSEETPLNSNYTAARGFIYDRFDPVSDKLISVPVTVTGTPTLSSIAPNDGDQGDSVAVTLTGTNFVPGGTNVQVAGGGVTVSGISVSGTTSLTATFTIDIGAATGARDVTVTTLAGTSGPVTFTVNDAPGPAPVLSDVTPDSGTQGSMIEVTLTGQNFTGTSVDISGVGVTVPSFTVDSRDTDHGPTRSGGHGRRPDSSRDDRQRNVEHPTAHHQCEPSERSSDARSDRVRRVGRRVRRRAGAGREVQYSAWRLRRRFVRLCRRQFEPRDPKGQHRNRQGNDSGRDARTEREDGWDRLGCTLYQSLGALGGWDEPVRGRQGRQFDPEDRHFQWSRHDIRRIYHRGLGRHERHRDRRPLQIPQRHLGRRNQPLCRRIQQPFDPQDHPGGCRRHDVRRHIRN